jgi:hypothetical protein
LIVNLNINNENEDYKTGTVCARDVGGTTRRGEREGRRLK